MLQQKIISSKHKKLKSAIFISYLFLKSTELILRGYMLH